MVIVKSTCIFFFFFYKIDKLTDLKPLLQYLYQQVHKVLFYNPVVKLKSTEDTYKPKLLLFICLCVCDPK